jgi:hypothetical protein
MSARKPIQLVVWRNGKTKTWKTRLGQYRIPVRVGYRSYGYLTHDTWYHLSGLGGDWVIAVERPVAIRRTSGLAR